MTGFATDTTACARTLLLSAGLALGLATAAQASTMNVEGTFGGTLGTLGIPTETRSTQTNANAPGTLLWGNPGEPRNSLTIVSGGFSASLDPASFTDLKLGEVQWYNASVFQSGGDWNLPMSFTIAFFAPAGADTLTPVLATRVHNTGDSAGVSLETTNATGMVPDYITGLSFGDFAAINLGGGWSVTGLYAARVGDSGPRTQCGTQAFAAETGVPAGQGSAFDAGLGNWINCENTTANLGIYAKVRYDAPPPSVIPLPAAGWLLLGGLGALGAAARRRRAA